MLYGFLTAQVCRYPKSLLDRSSEYLNDNTGQTSITLPFQATKKLPRQLCILFMLWDQSRQRLLCVILLCCSPRHLEISLSQGTCTNLGLHGLQYPLAVLSVRYFSRKKFGLSKSSCCDRPIVLCETHLHDLKNQERHFHCINCKWPRYL